MLFASLCNNNRGGHRQCGKQTPSCTGLNFILFSQIIMREGCQITYYNHFSFLHSLQFQHYLHHLIYYCSARLWCSISDNNNLFIQERIAKTHGSQCGFCTPGIVMSMYALLRNNPQPTMHDIQEAFQGILIFITSAFC